MKVLLFDMDGVLLDGHAYYRALQDTVGLVGEAIGFQDTNLTVEDIEVFESVGVTSEWDSSAICTALLLKRAWKAYPELDLPPFPPLAKMPLHGLSTPDFQSFFLSSSMASEPGESALERAEQIILKDGHTFTERQVDSVLSILRGARTVHGSITHRLFQEYVLGSDVFQTTYGMEPILGVEGYLLTDDHPALTSLERDRLLGWVDQPNHSAAVFTNRPSQPPQGYFDTPEAELGLKLVGMETVPVIGRGSLAWAAEERGLDVDSLLKPSSVHVLAALRRTLGDPLEQALMISTELALEEKADPSWRALHGAVVYAFEDSIKGLHSALRAQETLAGAGIIIELELIGVSASPRKRNALEAVGANEVFPNLSVALQSVI